MTESRDLSILGALWVWKGLPTAAVAEQFFGCQYSDAAYKALRGLRARGFIETTFCDRYVTGFLWRLKLAGFHYLRASLNDLREVGFRSEAKDHDQLCSAFQRGHWLRSVPSSVTLVSEQELRRSNPEHLDEWAPRSDIHRPDGITIVREDDGISVTALEVELHRKGAVEYAKLSSFYAPDRVSRVLWLAKSARLARWVRQQIQLLHPDRLHLHQFVILPDFVRDFWNAPVFLGTEAGLRIHQLFSQPRSPTLLTGETPAMLDLRRRPYSSKLYRFSADRSFLNRVVSDAPSYSFAEQAPRTAPRSLTLDVPPLEMPPQPHFSVTKTQTLEVFR